MSNLTRDCIYLILNEIKIKTFYIFTCKYIKSFIKDLESNKPSFRFIYGGRFRFRGNSHPLIKYINSILEITPKSIGAIQYECIYPTYDYDEDPEIVKVPYKIERWVDITSCGLLNKKEQEPSDEMIQEYIDFNEKMIKKYYK